MPKSVARNWAEVVALQEIKIPLWIFMAAYHAWTHFQTGCFACALSAASHVHYFIPMQWHHCLKSIFIPLHFGAFHSIYGVKYFFNISIPQWRLKLRNEVGVVPVLVTSNFPPCSWCYYGTAFWVCGWTMLTSLRWFLAKQSVGRDLLSAK